MTPFLESMPISWVLDLVAAQGVALSNVKTLVDNPDADYGIVVLNKALLFSSYMLYKSGLMSLQDQLDLINIEFADQLIHIPSKVPEAVKEGLTRYYECMDGIYAEAIKDKALISDRNIVKTTLQ